jgi:membrane associated rhomboid family serine protease
MTTPTPPVETLLRTTTSREELNTLSLVLSSARIDHRIRFVSEHRMEIHLHAELMELAEEQIQRFEEENKNWPAPPRRDDFLPGFRAMSPIVISLLVYIFSKSGNWQTGSQWFTGGAGDSAAILEAHELYRLVTALTLHADLVHLLSNCILGGILLHYFFLITGNGLGLFSLLATATLANWINVLARGPGHHFVGFSTAVFSVIGILCVLGSRERPTSPLRLLPLMAGLALLAMLGSGGERTDLGGHFFGLLVGLAGGALLKMKKLLFLRSSATLQTALAFFSIFVLFWCWHLALSA